MYRLKEELTKYRLNFIGIIKMPSIKIYGSLKRYVVPSTIR